MQSAPRRFFISMALFWLAFGLGPYWHPIFLVPGAGCFAFALYGFALARRVPTATH
jgi:hypothetical protein